MTTIKFYGSRRAMRRGIRKMELDGYKVDDTETVMVRRGCLTLMAFPPLVFFKRESFKVQYSERAQ
jgi:hypothetical protein